MVTLVDAAHDLTELIEAHADLAERNRRLPGETVAALTDAGLMRMCAPAQYGGPEADPLTLLEAVAVLAFADGAAGWCSMIASTTSSMAAFLPVSAAHGIDGFQVDGRWAWGSGTQHCQWVLGGALCDDKTFRLCWFPQGDITFHDTWHTVGMRGSGSLDYSVQAAFAPAEFTMQPGVTRPVVDTPLARFPNFALLAAAVSAVGLGIARRALDEVIDTAQGKKPQYSSKTLAQSGYTQIEVARAEAKLRSARAFLHDEVGTAWATVQAGDDATIEQRTGVRLAAINAATAGAEIADTAFTLAGGTAVYDTSMLGRCLRDAHVVTQHIQTAPKLNEKIGQLLLGQNTDTSMF
jgi:alkylation response protein AidB-like acyl-CoA dehydrogenase